MAGLGILNYGYDYSVDLGEYGSYGSNGSTSDIAFNLGGGVDYKLTVHSGLPKANSPSHRSGFIPEQGKNVLLQDIVTQVIELIDCELEIVKMELEHPERFVKTNKRPVSNVL